MVWISLDHKNDLSLLLLPRVFSVSLPHDLSHTHTQNVRHTPKSSKNSTDRGNQGMHLHPFDVLSSLVLVLGSETLEIMWNPNLHF